MPSPYWDYHENGSCRWYTNEPAAFTMGGNGAGLGTSAREFQMPILPQSQISGGGPIWHNVATTFEPQAAWMPPISYAENGNFFGLERSNIPINNVNWDGRIPCVLFLAQWNSSQSSHLSDYGHAVARLGNASHRHPGRQAMEVNPGRSTESSSTDAEMPAVIAGKRKKET